MTDFETNEKNQSDIRDIPSELINENNLFKGLLFETSSSEDDDDSYADSYEEDSIDINEQPFIKSSLLSKKYVIEPDENVSLGHDSIPESGFSKPVKQLIPVREIVTEPIRQTAEPEDKTYINKTEYINDKIKPIDIDEGVLMIDSSMDTYKSRSLREFLKIEVGKGKSYANLTYRRFLAMNQHQEFIDAGIPDVCYLDEDFNSDSQCITIQAESLYKIKNVPDILIFDECSSFFRQMYSGLHGSHLQRNRSSLEFLIKNSPVIICMDADLDDDFIEYIHSVVPNKPINLQINNYKHPSKQYLECPDDETMFSHLLPRLANGEKLAIVIGSVKKANVIQTKIDKYMEKYGLRELNGRIYTTEHKDYDIEEILHPNQNWINFDYIIYTSIIGAGIDFHVEHFDTMFVFGDCRSCSVDGHFQMIGRIRKIKQKILFYTLYTQKYNFSTDKKSILWKIMKQAGEQNKCLDKYLPEGEMAKIPNTNGFSWLPKRDEWFDGYISLEHNRLTNQKFFKDIWENKIYETGSQIIRLESVIKDNKDSKLIMEQDKIIVDGININRIEMFEEAEILTDNRKKPEDMTTMDIFSEKKTRMNELISHPTGKECVYIEKNCTQLNNIRLERDLTMEQLHAYDLDKKKFNPEYKPIAIKVETIREINKLIGFDNSWNNPDVVGDSREIMKHIGWFNNKLPLLRILFNVRCESNIKTWKALRGLIYSIYYNWSKGCFKTTEKKTREESKRIVWYQCDLLGEDYDNLLPHPYKEKVITKKKIVKLMIQSSGSTNLNYTDIVPGNHYIGNNYSKLADI